MNELIETIKTKPIWQMQNPSSEPITRLLCTSDDKTQQIYNKVAQIIDTVEPRLHVHNILQTLYSFREYGNFKFHRNIK